MAKSFLLLQPLEASSLIPHGWEMRPCDGGSRTPAARCIDSRRALGALATLDSPMHISRKDHLWPRLTKENAGATGDNEWKVRTK